MKIHNINFYADYDCFMSWVDLNYEAIQEYSHIDISVLAHKASMSR